jgi:hypothetical protein
LIPKRVFWFTAGTVAGFGGTIYAYARVREARGRFAADRLADTVSESVVGTARVMQATVRDAVVEGRAAMEEAERRIRADLDRP